MRLLAALLLTTVPLLAESLHPLPSIKKTPPVSKSGAVRNLKLGAPGKTSKTKAPPTKSVQGGALARAVGRGNPTAASKTRKTITPTPRPK